MGLFDLKNGQIVLNPDSVAIPAFRTLWEADKSKKKEKATQAIAYVYFITDFNSPYMVYPEHLRHQTVMMDFIKDKDWELTPEIKAAIASYKEFQETHSMRLLFAAREATDKLADYFKSVDFTETDDSGKLLYTAKDVASNLASVGKLVESLDKLEDKVKKEIKTESTVRGSQGKIGAYER